MTAPPTRWPLLALTIGASAACGAAATGPRAGGEGPAAAASAPAAVRSASEGPAASEWPAAPAAPAASASGRRVLDRETALGAVTAEGLRQHVAWLASDDLEGRNVGTPGLARAASYLQDRLAESGLTPAGDPRSGDRRRGYEQRFEVEGSPTTNVLATIEGSDPALAGEVVVVGAHFDHLGSARQAHPGRKGAYSADDSIWNGADDNASGTAVALSVAQALGAGAVSCRRTLLFAFFSAEEWGLRGSRWYTAHPVVPIESHRLMVNLDMVGRNPQIALAAMGAAPSVEALRPRVAAAARQAGLPVTVIAMKNVRDDSDHYPFHQQSVPFLFLYSGEHGDYHHVTDHADRLAYDRMAKVARFTARLALDACDAPAGRAP